MSNGDDTDDRAGPERPGSRRRQAVRPPTIEGEAREIPDPAPEAPEAVSPEAPEAVSPQAPETVMPEAPEAVAAPGPAATETEGPAPGESPEAAPEATAEAPEAAAGEPDVVPAAEPVPLATARRASLIAAGLVGALIGLAVYLGLYYGGVLPRDRSAMLEAAATRMDEADRRIAGLESSLARAVKRDNSKELAARVGGLEAALKELGAEPRNPLFRRFADMEKKVEAMAAGIADGSAATALEERIAAVEAKLAAPGPDAPAALPADLDARLAALEARLDAVEARPAAASPDGKPVDDAALKALSERIADLDSRLKETAVAGLAALRADLDGVAKSVDGKLAAVEQTIAGREAGESREVARATAAALAVAALERAAGAGRPYAAELDVLKPLLDDPADLSVLDAHAAAGVPDLASLQAGFPAAADAILAAGGDTPQAGLAASLLDSARALVRVRPTGQVAGEGRPAVVARIEAALKAGDLRAAASEWDGLDEAARAASQGWADGLKARLAVDGALAGLSSRLAASLSGVAGTD